MSGIRSVIYTDNPWKYRNRTIRGGAEHHYETMTTGQICAMAPIIDRLAAPDCALFTWAVWPMLRDALEVIDAWGFRYVTCAFAWVKLTQGGDRAKMGTGHYTRANTEICLLAVRGRPVRVDRGVPQVIEEEIPEEETIRSPLGEHSAKPAEARNRIVRLMGDVPRIELFARERFDGWASWGKQLPPLASVQIPESSEAPR